MTDPIKPADKTLAGHATPGSHVTANERAATTTKDVKKPEPKVAGPAVGKTAREQLLHERAERPVISVEAHLPTNVDEEIPVLDPNRPKPTPQEVEREKKQKELLAKIGKIMEEYDNRESSIPANHEYWQLVAQLRAL